MQDMAYTQLQTKKNGIKVILEFPNECEDEKTIRKEVKSIVSKLLGEQIFHKGKGDRRRYEM